MSDSEEILKNERAAFNAWNKTNHHNKTTCGDDLAWRAWRAAISNHTQRELDEGSSEDYLITMSRRWAKKIIRSLR